MKFHPFLWLCLCSILIQNCQNDKEPILSQSPIPTLSYDYSNEKLWQKIDTFFANRFRAKRFNGTVLFAQNGKIVYQKAFGFSNFKTKDSLEVNDAFQLASVSKTITAIAILKLIERQQLRLSDTVQYFFPNFPYSGVTVRHLLSHRSGLPNYMYFVDKIGADKNSSVSNADIIQIMARDTPKVYYSPDVRYHYCNTNFAILASIVEKVSGQTYEDFLQKEIFTPLNMESAFVYNRTTTPQLPKEVIGYNAIYRVKENIYLNGVVGDKGVYASVLDLYKLDQALYDSTFIAPQILETAFTPHNPDLTRRNRDNYGLGWRIQQAPEFGKVVYHSGWWKGFKTYFIRMIDQKQTIIVLTNVTKGGYLDRKAMQGLF